MTKKYSISFNYILYVKNLSPCHLHWIHPHLLSWMTQIAQSMSRLTRPDVRWLRRGLPQDDDKARAQLVIYYNYWLILRIYIYDYFFIYTFTYIYMIYDSMTYVSMCKLFYQNNFCQVSHSEIIENVHVSDDGRWIQLLKRVASGAAPSRKLSRWLVPGSHADAGNPKEIRAPCFLVPSFSSIVYFTSNTLQIRARRATGLTQLYCGNGASKTFQNYRVSIRFLFTWFIKIINIHYDSIRIWCVSMCFSLLKSFQLRPTALAAPGTLLTAAAKVLADFEYKRYRGIPWDTSNFYSKIASTLSIPI